MQKHTTRDKKLMINVCLFSGSHLDYAISWFQKVQIGMFSMEPGSPLLSHLAFRDVICSIGTVENVLKQFCLDCSRHPHHLSSPILSWFVFPQCKRFSFCACRWIYCIPRVPLFPIPCCSVSHLAKSNFPIPIESKSHRPEMQTMSMRASYFTNSFCAFIYPFKNYSLHFQWWRVSWKTCSLFTCFIHSSCCE